jgi:pyridoxal 5'-phosphate synthase pdxS subunit
MMQIGVDGVFVGSGIFNSSDPAKWAKSIVEATTHYADPDIAQKYPEAWANPWRAAQRVKFLKRSSLQEDDGSPCPA